jgi:membrane protease YdiL (CAAX protease family)
MTVERRSGLAFASMALAMLAAAGFGELARHAETASAAQLAWSILGVEVMLGAFAFAAAHLSREPALGRLGMAAGRLPWSLLALLVIGMLALSHALDGILELSGLREHSALAELPGRLEGARGGTLLLVLLALGVAPGFAEELLCRGLVQRGLHPRLGPVRAIGAGALLFGALHLEPVHAAFAMVLGAYLGVVAWWADSIRAAIGCHVVNNLASVGLAATLGPTIWAPELATAMGACVTLLCLWLVNRARPRPGAPPGGMVPACPSDGSPGP